MKKIKNYGKLAIEIVLTAILSAFILYAVSYVIGMFTSTSSWQTFFIAVLSAVFIIFAIKIHPGKESFIETIPIVIISIALVGLIQTWFASMPSFNIEFTWTGLAWGLSSVFLANTLVKKVIKSI
jgi:hypothetical protein